MKCSATVLAAAGGRTQPIKSSGQGVLSGSALGPQVPFERVPDLVAGRRVLLRGGWAYVSRHEARSQANLSCTAQLVVLCGSV